LSTTVKGQKCKYLEPKPYIERHIRTALLDTRIWDSIEPRNDDIIIATPAKAGTTWTQEIVSQLIFDGSPPNDTTGMMLSPWASMRSPLLRDNALFPQLTGQYQFRRFFKSHEPVGSVPYFSMENCGKNVKYIVVGRDYRDIIWSLHNHHCSLGPLADMQTNLPFKDGHEFTRMPFASELVQQFGGEFTPKDMWDLALQKGIPELSETIDGYPYWSNLWIIGSWLNIKDKGYDNIMYIHYNNLKDDLPGMIKKIAEYLEIDYDVSKFDTILHNCTFEAMKNKKSPEMEAAFKGGFKSFINKGTGGRWKDTLNDDDIMQYKELASYYMNDDQIHWLETGQWN